jgi:hypothetical protein
VVARLQINLIEVFGPYNLIKEVVDSGNWLQVSDCDFIKGSTIIVESPSSIFLLYQHNWAPTR